MGGVYAYRATAECTACGKVVDVGPFEMLADAVQQELDGWLTPHDPRWQIRDATGTFLTLCDDCMARPLRDTLHAITERSRARASQT